MMTRTQRAALLCTLRGSAAPRRCQAGSSRRSSSSSNSSWRQQRRLAQPRRRKLMWKQGRLERQHCSAAWQLGQRQRAHARLGLAARCAGPQQAPWPRLLWRQPDTTPWRTDPQGCATCAWRRWTYLERSGGAQPQVQRRDVEQGPQPGHGRGRAVPAAMSPADAAHRLGGCLTHAAALRRERPG